MLCPIGHSAPAVLSWKATQSGTSSQTPLEHWNTGLGEVMFLEKVWVPAGHITRTRYESPILPTGILLVAPSPPGIVCFEQTAAGCKTMRGKVLIYFLKNMPFEK